jgi:hypothetical protein
MPRPKRETIEIKLTEGDEPPNRSINIVVHTSREELMLSELLASEGILESLTESLKEAVTAALVSRKTRARAMLSHATPKRERPALANVLSPFSAPPMNGTNGDA